MTDIIFVDALSGVGYRNINLLLGLYIVSKYSDALTCGSIFLGIIKKYNEDLLDSVGVTHNSRKFTVVVLNGELDACFIHDGLKPDLYA